MRETEKGGLGERLKERVNERLGDPIWWNDVLQLAKTVLAAVAAWVIASSVRWVRRSA